MEKRRKLIQENKEFEEEEWQKIVERAREQDLIDKKIEKFQKEAKTEEMMVEMLDFIEGKEVIDEDHIK